MNLGVKEAKLSNVVFIFASRVFVGLFCYPVRQQLYLQVLAHSFMRAGRGIGRAKRRQVHTIGSLLYLVLAKAQNMLWSLFA